MPNLCSDYRNILAQAFSGVKGEMSDGLTARRRPVAGKFQETNGPPLPPALHCPLPLTKRFHPLEFQHKDTVRRKELAGRFRRFRGGAT